MLGRSMVRIPRQRNNTKPAGNTPNVRQEQGDPEHPTQGPHKGHGAGQVPFPHSVGSGGSSLTHTAPCSSGAVAGLAALCKSEPGHVLGSRGKVFGTLFCPGHISPSQEQNSSLAELRQSHHAAATTQTQPEGLRAPCAGQDPPQSAWPSPSHSLRPPDAVVSPHSLRAQDQAGVRELKPEISGTERTRSKSQGLMWLACTPTRPPKSTPNGSSPVEAPRSPRAAAVTQEVRPDVARLGVYPEDALEAGSEGRHRGPVPVQEVIVVLQPVGQHVVGDHAPAPFPHLQHSDLRWYHHSQRVPFVAFTQPGSSGHMRNKPASLPCSQGHEGPVTLP